MDSSLRRPGRGLKLKWAASPGWTSLQRPRSRNTGPALSTIFSALFSVSTIALACSLNLENCMSSVPGISPSSADNSVPNSLWEQQSPTYQQGSQAWGLPYQAMWGQHHHPATRDCSHAHGASLGGAGVASPPGLGPQHLSHKYYEYLTLCRRCDTWQCLLCYLSWCLVLTPCTRNGNRIAFAVDMLQMSALAGCCLASYT